MHVQSSVVSLGTCDILKSDVNMIKEEKKKKSYTRIWEGDVYLKVRFKRQLSGSQDGQTITPSAVFSHRQFLSP